MFSLRESNCYRCYCLPQGRVPSVLFFTPTARGVTTGTAAPTNSVTLFAELLETHTSPEPSIAVPAALARPPSNPVEGVNAAPALENSLMLLEFDAHTLPAPSMLTEPGALRPPPV